MNKITALILTKNEEKGVKKCIESLRFCDQILVIDDNSDDNTVKIAEGLGADVLKRSLNNDFASQKNYGLIKAKHTWVLSLDADEIITNELKNEIIEKLRNDGGVNGYYIRRSDVLWNKVMSYTEFGKSSFVRLARKDKGKWRRSVHEYWDVSGKLGRLSNQILHYSHTDMSQFVKNVGYYSEIHALENKKEGKSSNLLKIIIFPVIKFFDNIIIKKGLIDGDRAVVGSLMMSFHSFLSWSTLWLLKKEKEN